MKEYVLGIEHDFKTFPTEIEIEQQSYFLLKNDTQYLLASRVCPHMGYLIEKNDEELVCNVHGWNFDSNTGNCLFLKSEKLATFTIIQKDGQLIALI